MSERWIVNASPLIALGHISRLDLLGSLAAEVIVPELVAEEVSRVRDEASRILSEGSFRIEPVDPDEKVVRWGLGPGETAVLSLAKQGSGSVAVIDDLAARRCSSVLGIPTRGTVGVVLLAKKRGIIPSAASLLGELRDSGLYLSPSLVAYALSLAGEDPK